MDNRYMRYIDMIHDIAVLAQCKYMEVACNYMGSILENEKSGPLKRGGTNVQLPVFGMKKCPEY